MRTLVLVALAVLVLPTAAAAEPIATLAVGPGPTIMTNKEGPYYLAAELSAPEAPRPAEPQDDCAYRPPGPKTEPEPTTTQKLLAWDPTTSGSFADWFPTCVTLEANGRVFLRAAYNVSSGRYVLLADTDGHPHTQGFSAAGASFSGRSGAGVTADCVGCPSPP